MTTNGPLKKRNHQDPPKKSNRNEKGDGARILARQIKKHNK